MCVPSLLFSLWTLTFAPCFRSRVFFVFYHTFLYAYKNFYLAESNAGIFLYTRVIKEV